MTRDGFEPLARLEDLPDGTLLPVRRTSGERICLVNDGGELYAVSDVCTHQDFPMSEGQICDGAIECIWHGARFDLRSGAVLRAPATDPLPRYEVRVENDEILVGPRRVN
ncbi:MAG: Rieske (2Fe-2S) protein [Gemmatimonadaceae bacterium]